MLTTLSPETSTEESAIEENTGIIIKDDTKLEAVVRWIIYIITYLLAIIGQCLILMGLTLYNNVGLISPDKLGYDFKGIIYLFVLSGVVIIIVAITGGGWFNAHQGILLRVHSALTICAILLNVLLITIVAVRLSEYNANLYLKKCWHDFADRNKTADMMELQIRFSCCGQNGIDDYIETDYVIRMSCYKNFNMQKDPFSNGCKKAVKDYAAKVKNMCIIYNSIIIALLATYYLLCKLLYKWRRMIKLQ